MKIQWHKFLERKFLLALGGVVSGILVALGHDTHPGDVEKVVGATLALGAALGWIAAETSRDNLRDRLAADEKAVKKRVTKTGTRQP